MKRFIFLLTFFILTLCAFSRPAKINAATCSCVLDTESGQVTVATACGAGYTTRCTGGPAQMQEIGCVCTATSPITPAPSQSDLTCDNGTGIRTAIGCVHALGNQSQFLADILRWAVGIGGGIAFLLGIYAGFMIMTSAGNPERLKAGQELLTSAISGLILLIFSVFILKFIGVDILNLGQFGFGK